MTGRALESLPLKDRVKMTGKWIALEIYTPETLPLRAIAAEGGTAAECLSQLRAQGLDPSRYELTLVPPPF